jgi:peptidoglycan/xylan/chitin deacetylase (PgdA/CDA1 family)
MLFSLPVFMYHSVSRQPGRLYLSPELLEEQCRFLAAKGWRGISLAEAEGYFLRGRKLPSKACLFTFDDAYLDAYVYAEPILRAHGHCGAIFPVLDLLEEREALRPNRDDLARNPERQAELGDLHTPKNVFRAGFRVRDIRFCSWNEIRRMHESGVMSAAPHSLNHGRAIAGLNFKALYKKQGQWGFFAVYPYTPPWGMPLFPTDYGLAVRGYTVNPALFELVREKVPQQEPEAKAFLADKRRCQALLKSIGKLPWLGRQETEAEFRARVFAEFTACRERFAACLGFEPLSFCWPWGAFCQESIEEAERAGFRLLFCTSQTQGRYREAKPVRRVGVRFYTTLEDMLHKARLFSWRPVGALYEKQLRFFPNGLPWARKKRGN